MHFSARQFLQLITKAQKLANCQSLFIIKSYRLNINPQESIITINAFATVNILDINLHLLLSATQLV